MISYFLSLLWFIRETKSTLFWLYLWQLKEYHIGRFIDHFQTEKGKKLLFNKLLISKIILILFFLSLSLTTNALIQPWQNNAFILSLLILYFFESVKGIYDFFQKRFRRPIWTKKTIFLTFISLVFQTFYLFFLFQEKLLFGFWLLLFDILTPAITSGIVLLFQPLAILGRNQIIKKAKEKRKQFKDLLAIGITGSYGKTSTKEFLATILAEKYNVLKTAEHQNSEVGISQCILNDLKPEHEVFIVEMGAYNRGGIKLLCDITKPKIGILTGINGQHMATFGSQENIIKGKYELIESLPEDYNPPTTLPPQRRAPGLAIFNGNNRYCLKLYQKTQKPKKITYPTFSTIVKNVGWDVWAEGIKVEKEFVSFKVFSKNGDQAEFKVNLIGAQNVENILLAACCAKELGMSLKEISMACQKIKPEQSGLKLIKNKSGLNIIDATYSANPDGVISHLEYLKIWKGKKVIVMPCLIELGKATIEVHKKIGQKIGKVCNLAIITTKERFIDIKEGAIEKGMQKENILFIENPKLILEKIKVFCQPEDVILLESRVPAQLISFLIK